MMSNATSAMWFLPFVVPIALWVAWSDMKTMLIPNKAVLALVVVFAVVGFFVLPLDTYLWRWSHLAVVLVIGFALSSLSMIGAGDAKFAAAMAPFVALTNLTGFAMLFSVVLLAAFLVHRIARRIPALRNVAPDWKSWDRKDFPMGLALGSVLLIYLVLTAF